MRRTLAALAFVFASGLAGRAAAQADIVGLDTLHGVIDLRLAGADGEASFADGGFGKTRYGGTNDGSWRAHADVDEAGLEWAPHFGWAWSAVVDAVYQPGAEHPVDLLQAYVLYRPVPKSPTRFEFKAGYYYPPVSLENDAPFWGVTNTITASALNSWIGEEVKVAGLEASVTRDFDVQSVRITAGVFGLDDTAGTLLTYRGWALDDIKGTLFGSFELPALSPFASQVQDDETYSSQEIDHRLGGYGRIELDPSGGLALHAFYYDNRGDKVSVTDDMQWAWATRFAEMGLSWRIDEKTRLLAQAMVGRTQMGFETQDGLFADVSFRSAYALISRSLGAATLTGRLDGFQVTDNSLQSIDNNAEHGWALTGAWRRPLGQHADFRIEAIRVWSDRLSRAYGGLAPYQAQTVLQSSLRAFF